MSSFRLGLALDDAVEEAREDGGANTIDLRELTDFEWDRVVFFGAYGDEAEAERRLGFTWADADEELGAGGEQGQFLVFTDGDRVAKVVSYPSDEGQAFLGCLIEDEDGYQRSESVFRLVMVGDPGAASYVLVPAGLDPAEDAEFMSACGLYP